MSPVEITEDDFVEWFRTARNHLNPNAPCIWNDGQGSMFETYGDELAFVRSQPNANIWTYVDGDGRTYLVSGYHFVNRLGYFITEEPVPEGTAFEINMERS